jgi:hypothetical protein
MMIERIKNYLEKKKKKKKMYKEIYTIQQQ